MWFPNSLRRFVPLLAFSALPVSVLGGDILTSNGYSMCLDDPNIHVERLNVTYNRNTRLITFDVAGASTVEMNVTVDLVILAYGQQVYTRTFNPCDLHEINMPQICPVPATSFASSGQEVIPAQYASQIPSIAFNIPDLDGLVQLTLLNSQGAPIACVQSGVSNGHSFNIPVVSYAAAGVAAGALAMSAIGGIASAGHAGVSSTSSPSFGAVMGWFQGMATSGMLSVAYPKVYQSFTTNFAFSTGLVPWAGLQTSIDSFRKATGGNLTDSSYQYLTQNATLMYDDGKMNTTLERRAVDLVPMLMRRDTVISVNGTTFGNSTSAGNSTQPQTRTEHYVKGIEAYVEQLSIPQANTFMTVFLVWACVVGVIIVAILLVKVLLELWSMCGNLPKTWDSWRKRYWWRLAKTLTNLVLLLYGIWTLYCIYQFTNGDSWAAKALAGVTLGVFTAVLLAFTYKIWSKAQEYKKMHGDSKGLFDEKEVWIRYSLFYESYKKSYWWLFIPVIVYMFARGCVIAGLNGHGLTQAAAQLIVEALMLGLLLCTRPFERASTQWINITIQVVRVLSVGCVLLFVEELGMSQTTKTITGLILIVVQCVLTGVLAILIAVNAIIGCCKENPHRRKRKEAEQSKLDQDLENLTPLSPQRTSLAMDEVYKYHIPTNPSLYNPGEKRGFHDTVREQSPASTMTSSFTRPTRHEREEESLLVNAAGMGRQRAESVSQSPPAYDTGSVGIHALHRSQTSTSSLSHREPKLPGFDFGHAL